MFKLQAEPTFDAKVSIPVAGGKSVPVVFTFKHRLAKDLLDWDKAIKEKTDAEAFADMVVGWEIDEPFTPENVQVLLANRIGLPRAVYEVYIEELTRAREKN